MIARASAWRAYSASAAGSRVTIGLVADRLEDRAEVADRDALAEQRLQHALHLADAEQVGDELLDGGRVALLERVEQLRASPGG